MRTLLEAANRFLGEDEEAPATPEQAAGPVTEVEPAAVTTEVDKPVEVVYEGPVKDWLIAQSKVQTLPNLIVALEKQFGIDNVKAQDFIKQLIGELTEPVVQAPKVEEVKTEEPAPKE